MSTLATQATITLINNKGDINATLKQLASSATVRNMATSALTAGLTTQFNIGNNVNDAFAKKLSNGISRGITEAAVNATVNGTSFEDALTNSLRASLVDVFAGEAFSEGVKGIDVDTDDFARNLAHKLAAAGVGCVSASAKNQSCDAGAIGAAVGEMVGDYLIDPSKKLYLPNGEEIIVLEEGEVDYINNISKLVSGSVALIANVDVDTAASVSELATRNNSSSEFVYQAELDALWIAVDGDKEAYYKGVKKIAERDSVALDILMLAYPVGKAGTFVAKSGTRAIVRVFHRITNHKYVSTGRTQASNITEEMAIQQVKSNPQGKEIKSIKMNDTKNGFFAKDGWVKKTQIVETSKGKVEIHYAHNTKTGRNADFKFKNEPLKD